jgi:hypothetical protein
LSASLLLSNFVLSFNLFSLFRFVFLLFCFSFYRNFFLSA